MALQRFAGFDPRPASWDDVAQAAEDAARQPGIAAKTTKAGKAGKGGKGGKGGKSVKAAKGSNAGKARAKKKKAEEWDSDDITSEEEDDAEEDVDKDGNGGNDESDSDFEEDKTTTPKTPVAAEATTTVRTRAVVTIADGTDSDDESTGDAAAEDLHLPVHVADYVPASCGSDLQLLSDTEAQAAIETHFPKMQNVPANTLRPWCLPAWYMNDDAVDLIVTGMCARHNAHSSPQRPKQASVVPASGCVFYLPATTVKNFVGEKQTASKKTDTVASGGWMEPMKRFSKKRRGRALAQAHTLVAAVNPAGNHWMLLVARRGGGGGGGDNRRRSARLTGSTEAPGDIALYDSNYSVEDTDDLNDEEEAVVLVVTSLLELCGWHANTGAGRTGCAILPKNRTEQKDSASHRDDRERWICQRRVVYPQADWDGVNCGIFTVAHAGAVLLGWQSASGATWCGDENDLRTARAIMMRGMGVAKVQGRTGRGGQRRRQAKIVSTAKAREETMLDELGTLLGSVEPGSAGGSKDGDGAQRT